MQKNKLPKALLLVSFFFLPLNNGFSKTKSTLVEANLPNKSPEQNNKNPIEITSAATKNDNGTAKDIIDKVKDIITGKKLESLMFESEEIERSNHAIDSLKNNQVYNPDDYSSDGTLASADSKKKKKEDEGLKSEDKKSQESERSYIYLSSIMYFNANEWVVWVNNQKITPQSNSEDREISLLSVDKDKAKLLWKLGVSKWKIISGKKSEAAAPNINDKNQVEIVFELKPNQTFILGTNSVAEGRAVAALLSKKIKMKKRQL